MPEVNSSVVKALEIMDFLGQTTQGLRLKDIAHQLDLPDSTTHRLLASLAEKGYVQQREHNGAYALGWKIVTLARSLKAESRLVQDIRPFLEGLLRQAGHTINLAVLSDLQVMYLDCLVPNNSLSLYTAPGAVAPTYATALGKALLAHLPSSELEVVIPRVRLQRLTPQTITSPSEFRLALKEVQRLGYAVDRGEFKADVNCVGAPVKDSSGRAIAAISVTARAVELPANWEAQVAPLIVATSQEAARQLFG